MVDKASEHSFVVYCRFAPACNPPQACQTGIYTHDKIFLMFSHAEITQTFHQLIDTLMHLHFNLYPWQQCFTMPHKLLCTLHKQLLGLQRCCRVFSTFIKCVGYCEGGWPEG